MATPSTTGSRAPRAPRPLAPFLRPPPARGPPPPSGRPPVGGAGDAPAEREKGPPMALMHATDATFEELVLKSDKPVIVDFWAAWCGPCRMVAPALGKLGVKDQGR